MAVDLDAGSGQATFVLTVEDREISGSYTGILGDELFSAVILMVIGTTFIAPPLLKWSFGRWGTTDVPTD